MSDEPNDDEMFAIAETWSNFRDNSIKITENPKEAGPKRNWNLLTDAYCGRCKRWKIKRDFPNPKAALCSECRDAAAKRARSVPASEREAKRRKVVTKTYGMTPEDLDALVASQNNCCAICGREAPLQRPLVIDHDHETGVVRGLLCTGCNTSIGKLGDTPDGVRRAVDYLLNPPAPSVLAARKESA